MNREPQQIFDELMVLQSQDGDPDSISRLVTTWHPRLIRYAMKIVGEYESAVDAVQDSWIAILNGLKKIDDPAKFRSWAFRIVHNKSFDSIRSNIKLRNVMDEFSKINHASADRNKEFDAAANGNEEKQRLQIAIRKLRPDDQLVLGLYYEENLSIKEIELVTGATISSIKSRLDRIRKKLKSTLERKSDE